MDRMLHVVALEPYYGGSHAAFVNALKERSRHRITLVTLPARKWKWRMRGAAIWFVREATEWLGGDDWDPIDVILCSDMLSVADLRAMLPARMRNVAIVCYFHENQLTYPIPPDQHRDFQYGMTNITSCLASDAVWFNSRFHLVNFLRAAHDLLRKMPDFVPQGILGEIRKKAVVLPPPVRVERVDRRAKPINQPVTILWCHRWEYDKDPQPFFDTLMRLDGAGYKFNLAVVGEQFRAAPPAFASAWDRLHRHIVHVGYLPDRDEYLSLLSQCDIVVSTAIQENFGMAVIEAVLAGCQPLLPNRLAYPEIIPPDFHKTCLYASEAALFGRLRDLIDGGGWLDEPRKAELQASLEARYGAAAAIPRLDAALEDVVDSVRTTKVL